MRHSRFKLWALALVLCLVPAISSHAQPGWAVSELVRVPRTEFSVTGLYPYRCLSEEENAQLQQDVVHRFQVWASRWLEETFGHVHRLQRHASCTISCAVIPDDVRIITDIQAYYADGPSAPFNFLPLGIPGAWIVWDDTLMTPRNETGEQLVCLQVRNWVHAFDRYGYFIVYYER